MSEELEVIPLINENLPSLIQSLGLPFFVAFIVAAILTWRKTQRVYLSLWIGVAAGAVAFLLFGTQLHILL